VSRRIEVEVDGARNTFTLLEEWAPRVTSILRDELLRPDPLGAWIEVLSNGRAARRVERHDGQRVSVIHQRVYSATEHGMRSVSYTQIPDLAVLQTESAQQCSPVSFATLPTGSSCPYSGTGPRTFHVGYTTYDYYFSKYGANALHGVFSIPKDVASTIAASMPLFRAENRMGIPSDAEFGKSGTAIQTDYTEVAAAIKKYKSTYARNGLDYKGTVLERKEAQVQGVNTVKVWDCSVQCYDKRLIQEGGNAVDLQYVWLNFLPFEDKGANAELDSFLKYDKDPDGFGAQAWIAGEIFARAVNDTMKANNNDPNSITRPNLLTAVRAMHDFDANGMVPKIDVGRRVGSTCLVGMQVQNGKFVRVDPLKPGTFDCDNNKPAMTLTIDPAKEYHG
jgi:hypothetical protein